MAEIELVIKIDEKDFEIMKHNVAVDNPLCPLSQKEMVTTIANGTPLLKERGEWIPLNYKDEMWGYVYKCSNCGATEYKDNFCPNCGMKMETNK